AQRWFGESARHRRAACGRGRGGLPPAGKSARGGLDDRVCIRGRRERVPRRWFLPPAARAPAARAGRPDPGAWAGGLGQLGADGPTVDLARRPTAGGRGYAHLAELVRRRRESRGRIVARRGGGTCPGLPVGAAAGAAAGRLWTRQWCVWWNPAGAFQ